MKRNSAQKIALGGLMAALAIVIMCLGGLIPFATFVCPMLCCMITKVVLSMCGKRIAWAWYGAVAILSVLMAPDKEAAAVFVFLGYYPIVKPWMDKLKLSWLWKGLLFNCAILLMYWLLIHILGLSEIANDYEEAGTVITVVMLLLGNVTFFMLDLVLGRRLMRRHG
jgi:hypothetical protein